MSEKNSSRAGFGLRLAALAVKSCFVHRTAPDMPAVRGEAPELTPIVQVAAGQLQGVYNEKKTVEVYAGIPYAKPPVGNLRWREPEAPEGWEGVRVCDHFMPMAMQPVDSPVRRALYDYKVYRQAKPSLSTAMPQASEDCLYLNIWKPAGGHGVLPVLFFIHGGGLTNGQAWFEDYNGESLAKKGIIVVNFAYRLGIFGYLAHPLLAEESPNHTTGNYGLLDQLAALAWVRENISAFGGDPDNITVAGESAGACAVGALCVSPLAKGQFRRAIAESGGITPRLPYHSLRKFEDALETGKGVFEEFDAATPDALREKSAKELLRSKFTNNAMTVDGYAIPDWPYRIYERGENNEEAVLGGFNLHEADLFLLLSPPVTRGNYRERLSQVVGSHAAEAELLFRAEDDTRAKEQLAAVNGACWFAYSHHLWSKYLAAQGRPAYQYLFAKDNKRLGANHGGEMVYAYGNLRYHPSCYGARDQKLSAAMKEYWANFVRTGNPNGEGLPRWCTSAEEEGQILLLDGRVDMVRNPYLQLYEVIDRHQRELTQEKPLAGEEAGAAEKAARPRPDTLVMDGLLPDDVDIPLSLRAIGERKVLDKAVDESATEAAQIARSMNRSQAERWMSAEERLALMLSEEQDAAGEEDPFFPEEGEDT